MSTNRSTSWLSILIFAWLAGSILGILYSFKFLFGAIVFFIWWLVLLPSSRAQDKAWKALSKFFDFRKGAAPKLSEDEMKLAASWYMISDWNDFRSEDLNSLDKYTIPEELRKYLKSEKDFPRRW